MQQLRNAVQEAATTLGLTYIFVLFLVVAAGVAFLLATQM
jgi:hypothetical protein